ncbi:hypothetical protein V1264_004579 [Littorina saxatilis]|uniref:HTH CENPB-type domain-containing protein n=1 Tax=Littorina saxatilis TaxID=31220 RepID=A0AAN9B1Q3_9CAEN
MPRRQSYTVEFKLATLDYLEHFANGNVSQTAEEFGIDRKMIREWRTNRDRFIQHDRGTEKKKRKLHPGRHILSQEVDQAVLDYLNNERAEGRVVRNKDLQRKAMELAGAEQLQGFRASPMWVKRWKKRHGVCTRRGTCTNQRVPADYGDQLLAFRRSVLRPRLRNLYPLIHILNMDQTMVRFDMLPKRTNDTKGAKIVRTKTTRAEKRGFTVALLVAADGTKFPAFIIFRERNGNIPQRVLLHMQVPDNVRVSATRNGWMTRESLFVWIERVLGHSDQRRLLVLDQYAAHRTANVQAAMGERDVDLASIPGGCTALAQPIDVGIVKPFKDALRDSWVQWMTQPRPLTAAGNLRQPLRQDVVTWVGQAWERVGAQTIVTSFLRCAISNALDGSQDDQTLEWFPDNIQVQLPRGGDGEDEEEEEENESSDEGDDMEVDFGEMGDE